jgi:hypothetical protein
MSTDPAWQHFKYQDDLRPDTVALGLGLAAQPWV